MKQLFYIDQGNSIASDILALQIGEKHMAFAITDQTGHDLKELAWCIADDRNTGWSEKELSEIIYHYPSLRNSIKNIRISYQFSDADWKADYYFYLPGHIKKFTEYFHSASFQKQYSLFTEKGVNPDNLELLFVDFRNEEFSVVGLSGKQLLLSQTYRYENPADVIYYLLRICKHFLLSRENLLLEVSGLIEKDSGLYRELFDYFKNVNFRNAGWKTETGHPAHFFTSLNDLAACAS